MVTLERLPPQETRWVHSRCYVTLFMAGMTCFIAVACGATGVYIRQAEERSLLGGIICLGIMLLAWHVILYNKRRWNDLRSGQKYVIRDRVPSFDSDWTPVKSALISRWVINGSTVEINPSARGQDDRRLTFTDLEASRQTSLQVEVHLTPSNNVPLRFFPTQHS